MRSLLALHRHGQDALLLLSLATTMSARVVFAAGSVAFTISSAVIVLTGSTLILYVPVFWIRMAGGLIMLAYAICVHARGLGFEKSARAREERLAYRAGRRRRGRGTTRAAVDSTSSCEANSHPQREWEAPF